MHPRRPILSDDDVDILFLIVVAAVWAVAWVPWRIWRELRRA